MKRFLRCAAYALTLLAAAGPGFASAARTAWLPDYARLQFAGQTGMLSLGAGYGFLDGMLEPELLYGFAPRSVAGIPIHTVAQKTTMAPLRFRPAPSFTVFPVLAGCSINAALGSRYFLIPPVRFRNYYAPSGLNFWLFTGTRLRWEMPRGTPVRALSAVLEVGALDDYLIAGMQNESIAWGDMVNLALAIQTGF